MNLRGSVIVLGTALPDAEVRRTVCSFDVVDQILDEYHFIHRIDDLKA